MNRESKSSGVIIHGHRGCRGLMPENTIPAFLTALQLNIDALELDVVCTADSQLLVSHEPFFSSEICTREHAPILKEEELSLNIYKMTAQETALYRCGTKPHPRFPGQQQIETHKPLLSEVVSLVKGYANEHHTDVPILNVEIKTHHTMDAEGHTLRGDGIWHPHPAAYAELVLREIELSQIADRFIIQSFDVEILKQLHLRSPHLKLVYLTEEEKISCIHQLQEIGFKPWGFAPHFSFVDEALVSYCTNNGIELLTWTVNEESDIKRMIELGVGHIITDYPNRAITVRDHLQ